jgi:hypothetical protein
MSPSNETSDVPTLPQFVRDLLAAPPQRGSGLNLWLYRVARVLHPYRDSNEIIELLRAATDGEPVKRGEIERAVERSKTTAWKPGQAPQNTTREAAWPKVNAEQREAVIASGGGLVDLSGKHRRCDFTIMTRTPKKSSTHFSLVIRCCAPGEAILILPRKRALNGMEN